MKSPKSLLLVFLMHLSQCWLVKANDSMPVIEPVTSEQSTLKLVHVLFRHGIRTPVNTYRNDPHINETFYPFGWGHLTNHGKSDLFRMGQWLSERYHNLVPFYNPDLVFAKSTASPRTLMSMGTVLAGMFPPRNTPMEWNSDIDWQPIPIFSEPLEQDVTLRMQADCPAYNVMKNSVKIIEKPEGIFDQLAALTGDNVTSAGDISSIFITLWTEQLYGLKLPEWLNDLYPDKMRFMAEQSYADLVATIEMQRIKAGPFLETLTNQMLAKASDTLEPKKRKIFLYCAHDWTITNILISLNVWKRQMPDFAALILFELHQNLETQEYYMELYFQNGADKDLEQLTLPGCSFQCPISKVLELWQNVLPTGTYEEMCQID